MNLIFLAFEVMLKYSCEYIVGATSDLFSIKFGGGGSGINFLDSLMIIISFGEESFWNL
mgnify:CR=1 FL=1